MFTNSLLASAVVVFLFLAGLWFLGAIINAPNFHPNFAFVGPNHRRRRPAASHVDWSQAGLC